MPKLTEERKLMRIASLETAGAMIEGIGEEGSFPECHGFNDEEFDIFLQENKRTAKILYSMADKLKDGE